MEELKPCPFCGYKARVETTRDAIGDYQGYVECLDCVATVCGPGDMPDAESAMNEAVSAWNRRAERTCHHAWKWDGLDGHDPACSRCGHEWPRESRNIFDYSDFNYCPYCGAKVVDE